MKIRSSKLLRRGFTIVEITVASFILVLVFLMGFTFFSGERKGVAALTEDLDINATIEAAFSQLSRDIRASAEVGAPDLMDVKDARPKFEFGKNSVCVLKQLWPDYRSTPISTVTTIVRYWLDKPVKVGDMPGGGSGVTYSLFRKVIDGAATTPGGPPATAAPDKPDKPLLTGIQELAFYRTKFVPGAVGPNGSGPLVVHLNMKVCSLKSARDGHIFRGYAAEMDTMVKLRGSQ